ncbi:glycosyltransferase family 2 protein [Marinigracilibium pacificum]|uniref:Glycosyltransferase family 2 protein n=1 Tax=Marinigracilibium pacificum TaxID=2729599 RepID=A0A848IYZ3_9BACT|nr:glycosyltransferase family 2 protein [Marinigracilibium pacificum]NMM47219.1 glycosyltransferase family 2 protein [Marinigracilibium pacificum]
MKLLFWIALFIVVYTFVGYGVVLFVLTRLKRLFSGKRQEVNIMDKADWPDITVLIAAYNEKDDILEKLDNTLGLDYPKNKLHILFVTDGSDDGTPEILQSRATEQIIIEHSPERKGKIAAVDRVMSIVQTPIVIYTDANTFLNKDALKNMVRHFDDENVGAVAGEKRIEQNDSDHAAGAGEGFYWKYESLLKKWDDELVSVVGAAGELFAIRTNLYKPVSPDTIIEDFVMTVGISLAGNRVAYEPNAYATERSSANTKEEKKRKVRIAAGGIQAISRMPGAFNFFKHFWLSFAFISHRVLRWTITPFALIFVFFANLYLWFNTDSTIYSLLMYGQFAFYLLALVGWVFESRQMRIKIFFVPYYFCMMNISVIQGIFRHLKGSQSVVWERAKRAEKAV